MKKVRFFLDFDGTITEGDVVDKMLERFADPAWRRVEKDWAEGRIGSRECLSKQVALVKANEWELASLLEKVKLDPGFEGFLACAAHLEVPVTIVSDGFDLIIAEVLTRRLAHRAGLLNSLDIYCNALRWSKGRPQAVFPQKKSCRHGCANCKERLLRKLARPGEEVIFVGDGLSDRFAAGLADLTFAKGKLLSFCREKRLAHRAYDDFSVVTAWLRQRIMNGSKTKKRSYAAF